MKLWLLMTWCAVAFVGWGEVGVSGWTDHPLYEIAGGENGLGVSKTLGSHMTLAIRNLGNEPRNVEVSFPVLQNLGVEGLDDRDLWCFFPRQGRLATNAPKFDWEESYSGKFPFQMMDVSAKGCVGLCLIIWDGGGTPKKFFMSRRDGRVRMGVKYRTRQLKPGEVWELPSAEVCPHDGDWHVAFRHYREWASAALHPMSLRKNWFRDVYNFRQVFLHNTFGNDAAYDEKTRKLELVRQYRESVAAFGGVEFMHVFDYGKDPVSGRCGDYAPWKYYGETLKSQLVEQIRELKRMKVPVGFYYEGYLINKSSEVGKAHGGEWSMLDRNGQPYARFGGEYHYACPFSRGWQDYLAKTVQRDVRTFDLAGVYLDELGFGWQYPCFAAGHGHDTLHSDIAGETQVPGEIALMLRVRKSIPATVTYTEEFPVDVATPYQDGSFSYGVAAARSDPTNPAAVDLTRFAFPDFKIFEILKCDAPMGDDLMGVKHVFFNGNGLWLEGPTDNAKWFPPTICAMIRKCHEVLRRNREAFRSMRPEPLVPTLDTGIYANCFPTDRKTVWTVYNSYPEAKSLPVLKLPHQADAIYYDEWRQQPLVPAVVDGYDVLTLPIEAKGVSCVSRTMPLKGTEAGCRPHLRLPNK